MATSLISLLDLIGGLSQLTQQGQKSPAQVQPNLIQGKVLDSMFNLPSAARPQRQKQQGFVPQEGTRYGAY